MTDAPAAITAQLVDVRNVAAHKSVRLELHVPAEQAGLVMAAFGWPTMADPVPVALARLTAAPVAVDKPDVPKERRPFSELPYAQQAAMRCNEPEFQRFLQENLPDSWAAGSVYEKDAAKLAAAVVRVDCGVGSRSEIVAGTTAASRWEQLDADFYAWSRGMR